MRLSSKTRNRIVVEVERRLRNARRQRAIRDERSFRLGAMVAYSEFIQAIDGENPPVPKPWRLGR